MPHPWSPAWPYDLVAKLLAETIKRIHHDQSVSALFKPTSSGGLD